MPTCHRSALLAAAVLSVTATFLTLPAAAQPNRPWEALCRADEDAQGGCQLRGSGKLVAICVPKGQSLPITNLGDDDRVRIVTPDLPFMAYRFGRPGAIELDFPGSRPGSAARFRTGGVTYAAGWHRIVAFTRGQWRYLYVERNLAGDRLPSGVRTRDVTHYLRVFRNGRAVATFRCTDDNQG